MVCDGSEGLSYIEPLPLAGDEKIFLKITRKLSTLNIDRNLLKKIRNLRISKLEITKKIIFPFPDWPVLCSQLPEPQPEARRGR